MLSAPTLTPLFALTKQFVTFQISRFHFFKKKETETKPETKPVTRCGCGNP